MRRAAGTLPPVQPDERPAGARERLARTAAWLAVVVVCALPLPALWRSPGPPMEEGFMLVFPELVLRGEVPNRDFLHLYGPGGLWVLAAKTLATQLTETVRWYYTLQDFARRRARAFMNVSEVVMLQNPDLTTIPVRLARFVGSEGVIRLGPLAAASLLATIPSLLVFTTLQRRITSGLLAGGVKG